MTESQTAGADWRKKADEHDSGNRPLTAHECRKIAARLDAGKSLLQTLAGVGQPT